MASKLHSLSLMGVALVVFLGASSVPAAMMVTNGGTTLFEDDFEADTVGSPPTNPEVGAWVTQNGSVAVTNAVSPGPARGKNYLSMTRSVVVGTAWDVADFGAVSSGTLSASFFVFIPTGALDNVLQVSLAPVNTNSPQINIFTAPVWLTNEGGFINTYVAPGGDASDTSTGVPIIKGIWQTWEIDYTFVAGSNNDTFTLSVDGNTSAPINAGGYGNVADPASLRYLGFRTGANGTFYIDAPEPASLGLLAVGGLMLLRRRRA